MDDNHLRTIGKLEEGMARLTEAVARLERNTREDFNNVFAKLEKITAKGCARGEDNTRRLDEHDAEHERHPERVAAIVASLAAIISAIAAFFGLHLNR